MMLTTLFVIIGGVFVGLITGIIPGLHINLLAIIIVSLAAEYVGDMFLPALFILSVGVTHNFVEAIPTLFFSTPTAETALVPAAQLLKEGKGYSAVQFFVVGALLGILMSILFAPLLFFIIPLAYAYVKNFTGWILSFVLLLMILKEDSFVKKMWAFVVTLSAGIFGTLVLQSSILQPLFLLLSGLFGASSLVFSIIDQTKIPAQNNTTNIVGRRRTVKAATGAVGALMLTTLLPGIGAAQASVVPSLFLRVQGTSYITLLGSIGTADFIVSLITFVTIQKARNGAIAIMTSLVDAHQYLLTFFATTVFVGGLALLGTLLLARKLLPLLNVVNYSLFCFIMLLVLFFMTFVFAGIQGILVMITGLSIGSLSLLKGVSRSHAMSCLIVPVIIQQLFS